ncbi:MAG: PIN domain-containing protein [Alphaproteobacteria bacterium]
MTDSRFTLDTNLLIYSIDTDSGTRHEVSKSIVIRAAMADCVLTLQVLGEFFHAVTRKGHLPAASARDFVTHWIQVFPVCAANEQTLAEAMRWVDQDRLSFWDAMIIGAAREASCSVILTEDMQDGRQLEGIELINPFSATGKERAEALLPIAL